MHDTFFQQQRVFTVPQLCTAPTLLDWVEFWVKLGEEQRPEATLRAAQLERGSDRHEIRLAEKEATARAVRLRTILSSPYTRASCLAISCVPSGLASSTMMTSQSKSLSKNVLEPTFREELDVPFPKGFCQEPDALVRPLRSVRSRPRTPRSKCLYKMGKTVSGVADLHSPAQPSLGTCKIGCECCQTFAFFIVQERLSLRHAHSFHLFSFSFIL